MRSKSIRAADLFCGAGGTSSGLAKACLQLGLQLELLAVNHWDIAIETHSANHPAARHLCTSVDNVDPRKAVPGGKLDLLIASPECTHHSNARGGKPVSDQKRASGWIILRWAEALRIETILIENVREFRKWGPIGTNGRPMKSRQGETYQAFLAALRSLGYAVEDRILNSADYGDPTTRERLFIQARRGRKPIQWPIPTHTATGGKTLFGKADRWRPAREIIDWSIPSKSIFDRERPLAPATMARIAAGLRKFGGDRFIVPFRGERKGQQPRCHSVDTPLKTITTEPAFGVCEPFLVVFRNNQDAQSVDRPIPTLTTSGANVGLCQPFLLQQQSCGAPRSTENPVPTIATAGAIALVEPFIIPLNHGKNDFRQHDLDQPMPTITTVDAWALIEPFLMKYNSTGGARPISQPLNTVTTKDRYGLVTPEVDGYRLDIHFRMLQPHELAGAMGFESGYRFAGSRENKVKQIGNAVPVNTAAALCGAILQERGASRLKLVEKIA